MSDQMLQARVEALVSGFDGFAGVAATNMTSGQLVECNAQREFPTASAIKIFVAYELFRLAEAQQINLSERISVMPRDHTPGSGLLCHLDAGLEPTIRDLAVLMMAISDNTAANILIDRLGVEQINATLAANGYRHTRLGGGIDFDKLSEDKFALGVGTPAEFVRFFSQLWRCEILMPPARRELIEMMRIQKYIEPLRRRLPSDPYAREFGAADSTWVASKTGSLDGVRCETGLVYASGAAWAICVMTKDVQDLRPTSDNEATLLIADLSRLVFDAWRGDQPASNENNPQGEA